jgi:hypothetical protein
VRSEDGNCVWLQLKIARECSTIMWSTEYRERCTPGPGDAQSVMYPRPRGCTGCDAVGGIVVIRKDRCTPGRGLDVVDLLV